MSLMLEDLVEAARASTAVRRRKLDEGKLRAEAEEIGRHATPARLRGALEAPGVSVIAEAKGASPLHGTLREDFDPVALAATYREHGAAAISVLTEEHYFAGSIDHLAAVSTSVDLPTLRKDFVVDLYQVFEAASAGAAAILLIAELLDGAALSEFVDAAHSVGLDALVEFHRPDLLVAAVEAGSGIVGINNRDLDTMEVDSGHALRLAAEIPLQVVSVAESAISGAADVARVAEAGFDAVLVGTALVTADDPGEVLGELVEAGRAALPKARSRAGLIELADPADLDGLGDVEEELSR